MGDDTKVSKNKRARVKGKKFASMAARLHAKYGHDAKHYTLRGNKLFKDGMNFENRKCTDKLCLIIFWLMLVGKFYFFYVGFTNGNIDKVLNGVSGDG
tara:strand:+ start:111 stop:404 length:294 start_codon:yes stop_codon:yes gene_type:complete